MHLTRFTPNYGALAEHGAYLPFAQQRISNVSWRYMVQDTNRSLQCTFNCARPNTLGVCARNKRHSYICKYLQV